MGKDGYRQKPKSPLQTPQPEGALTLTTKKEKGK